MRCRTDWGADLRPFSASGFLARFARCGNHSLKNVDEKGRTLPSVAFGEPLGRVAPSRTLFDCVFDDLDLLVGQAVEFVHDLVDQLVGALDPLV